MIVAGAEKYARERNGQNSKYTKAPASWLNGLCWLDEQAGAATSGTNWRDDPAYAGVE